MFTDCERLYVSYIVLRLKCRLWPFNYNMSSDITNLLSSDSIFHYIDSCTKTAILSYFYMFVGPFERPPKDFLGSLALAIFRGRYSAIKLSRNTPERRSDSFFRSPLASAAPRLSPLDPTGALPPDPL